MTSRSVTAPASIVHRYPWSGEEIAIIGVLLVVPPAVIAYLWSGGGSPVVLAVVLHAVGWGTAVGLWLLGRRRKNASMVRATLTGSRLTVSGGRVKASTGDLASAVGVTTTRMGPETVLVVALRDGSVMVPGRIAHDPGLTPALRRHLLRTEVTLSAAARELLDA